MGTVFGYGLVGTNNQTKTKPFGALGTAPSSWNLAEVIRWQNEQVVAIGPEMQLLWNYALIRWSLNKNLPLEVLTLRC